MQLLDGQSVARAWRAEIHERVLQLKGQGATPGLAVVLVGEDPASILYTTMKERASLAAGFFSRKQTLPATATTEEVVAIIQSLNEDAAISGILVQLPLPPQINTDTVLEAIDPNKDVDGLHPKSLGDLLIGHERLVPATPKGIMRLLEHYRLTTEGQHVVIVGRSNILGKPLAALFLNRNATVTICHTKTSDLRQFTRQADIIVMDTGVPGLLTRDMVRDGAIVIDAGITKLADGRVVGDVVFDQVKEKARAITPVPGGVGPMTIAALLDNTLGLLAKEA